MGRRPWQGVWRRARIPSLVVIKRQWLHGDLDGTQWGLDTQSPLALAISRKKRRYNDAIRERFWI
jgi:hypothetical protein